MARGSRGGFIPLPLLKAQRARSQRLGVGSGLILVFWGILVGQMLGAASGSLAAESAVPQAEESPRAETFGGAAPAKFEPIPAELLPPRLASPRPRVAPANRGTTLSILPPAAGLASEEVQAEVPPSLLAETEVRLSKPTPAAAGEGAPGKPERAETGPAQRPADPDDPFLGEKSLSVARLVAAVEARNPSIQEAVAAWRAAAEQYPQVISLEDPMFGFLVSTGMTGNNDGAAGYMLELSQEIPWPGKRQLRGAVAAAQAEAAQGAIGETRLRLAEAAKKAFFDYYLAVQLLEVNRKTVELMKDFRKIAEARYTVEQAAEQDVLQAELELAELENRQAEFLRDRRVAAARINTLLHRAPLCPLPPPPGELTLPEGLPPSETLQELALRARPELFAQGARIRAEEAALALAGKEYYPDVNLMARYDGSMMEDRMRPMVGMSFNIPLRRERRDAAVRQRLWRLQQERAAYLEEVDAVQFEVQAAWEGVVQGEKIVRFFVARILPAAEENLKAAEARYVAGQIDFLRLLDAERQYDFQRQRYFQAIAEYYRRLAELERAVGAPLLPAVHEGEAEPGNQNARQEPPPSAG